MLHVTYSSEQVIEQQILDFAWFNFDTFEVSFRGRDFSDLLLSFYLQGTLVFSTKILKNERGHHSLSFDVLFSDDGYSKNSIGANVQVLINKGILLKSLNERLKNFEYHYENTAILVERSVT